MNKCVLAPLSVFYTASAYSKLSHLTASIYSKLFSDMWRRQFTNQLCRDPTCGVSKTNGLGPCVFRDTILAVPLANATRFHINHGALSHAQITREAGPPGRLCSSVASLLNNPPAIPNDRGDGDEA